MRIDIVGILGPRVHYLFVYWAYGQTQAEDEGLSKEEKSLPKEAVLVKRLILVIKV